MKETYTAIIPVRAGSQRLKNKNILPFGESNLLIHKIRQLKKVSLIDKIVVSSDCDIMLDMAKSEGVKIHRRGLPFADDQIKTINEVVAHIVSEIKGDHILWLQCTSPLLDVEHYVDAIKQYHSHVVKGSYDSLLSVSSAKYFFWDETKPLNFSIEYQVRSQALPNWYVMTCGIWMASQKIMLERKGYIGIKPYLFEVDKIAAIDIDDEYDMEMARALYEYTHKKF